MPKKRKQLLPGFELSLGLSLLYLSLLVFIPFAALFWRASSLGLAGIWELTTSPRVLAAFRLSLLASLFSASLDALLGLLIAWVLVRYRFPGRRILDALVDIPFALPTAVAGIALTSLLVPSGLLGSLLDPLGIHLAFTPIGIVIALTFIGLPFGVRSIQPILEALEPEVEEAAACLGASRFQTLGRVILPSLLPAIVTGFALALARGLGEYGSVVFISGNLPMKTEIVPLLIMSRLMEFDYAGATAMGTLMLLLSFGLLLGINSLQALSRPGKN